MEIRKQLLKISIRKAVIFVGTFLTLLFCFMMYSSVDLFSVSYRNNFFQRMADIHEKQLYHHNILNITKIPSALKMVYNASCSLQVSSIPGTNIQMLDMYKSLKFDNPYGGFWHIPNNPNHWTEKRTLKVFVVPHSHNDPGWLKTFEAYYYSKTKYILNNMIVKLSENQKRKFIWAEISFFSMWWNELQPTDKETVKRLIHNNQLEFVSGGWVMNDEANSHWLSIMHQLTEGHQWLKRHLNYTPTNHWAIDPFGLSATQPMLLQQMGFQNMVIQRVHYTIKKHFGNTQNLQFQWKQLWDDTGTTQIFTEMLPFSGYGVSQSCGPDASICYDFDFRRLTYWNWPWNLFWNKRVPLKPINNGNVRERAHIFLDQLRKKSSLFKTDVLLVPLGNDFTFVSAAECDAQFQNYEKLFDFMNADSEMHIQIQFGTLSEYFKAVHEEKVKNFPVLTGDFFTYADEGNQYWSGYFTSRPFYKRMDRELLSYIRAAEIILTLAHLNKKSGLKLRQNEEKRLLDLLIDARQNFALFQHHDAITGTSRKHVVEDYGKRLLQAIKNTQNIIEYCTTLLLLSPSVNAQVIDSSQYNIDDIRYSHDTLAEQETIFLSPSNGKAVVIFNSLPTGRREIVRFMVSTQFLEVVDFRGESVKCQVSPVFEDETTVSASKFEVSFIADVPALGLVTYYIYGEKQFASKTVHASIKVFNYKDGLKVPLGFSKTQVFSHGRKVTIKNDRTMAFFNSLGLLTAIRINTAMNKTVTIPLDLDFVKYGTKGGTADKSGAYLFLPNTHASSLENITTVVRVIKGPLLSSVTVKLPYVQHSVILYNTLGADSLGIEIQNIVDIRKTSNFEIVMRLSTQIDNNDEFFTDLNGYQMVRRKRFAKLPLQANYYPVSSMAYLEDATTRLTLVTGTPLGCTSLKSGQLEIMLDRKADQDDHLGLGQGVMDNHPTKHIFNIILERKASSCKAAADNHPSGFPSLSGHVVTQSLLNPLIRMFQIDNNKNFVTFDSYSPVAIEFGVDCILASLRNDVFINHHYYTGIVLHRQHLDVCFAEETMFKQFPLSYGSVNISAVLPQLSKDVEFKKSSLSFLYIYEEVDIQSNVSLCPMEMQAFVLRKSTIEHDTLNKTSENR